ncbi:HNH endonuclease signature motif containing protein [Larkinella sp. C7]|uniref:HNH endonuclease signature motif containing protein n=1 Tax=Larkinella sp. C7 TaxID=2576607 RepID=UPI0011111503|nr:HNH endonuclease [Larkinella sp. C7]
MGNKNNRFSDLTNFKRNEKSRYIPVAVQREVSTRHFFECAWDSTPITHQHHIFEYAQGGLHTPENLILLCPNCHDQVHKGEIPIDELIKRKSTHMRGDRFPGLLLTNTENHLIRIGGSSFLNVQDALIVLDEPMISLRIENGRLFLSVRFYNKKGDLIFWMSRNRYWAPSSFRILTSRPGEIRIIDRADTDHYLRIWENGKSICITGNSYFKGIPIKIDERKIAIGPEGEANIIVGGGVINRPFGIVVHALNGFRH